MKNAYPIVMTTGEKFIVVFVPDFNINTQGANYVEAIQMARDAIGLVGVDMVNDHEELPKPSDLRMLQKAYPNTVVALVDVDFEECRRNANIVDGQTMSKSKNPKYDFEKDSSGNILYKERVQLNTESDDPISYCPFCGGILLWEVENKYRNDCCVGSVAKAECINVPCRMKISRDVTCVDPIKALRFRWEIKRRYDLKRSRKENDNGC